LVVITGVYKKAFVGLFIWLLSLDNDKLACGDMIRACWIDYDGVICRTDCNSAACRIGCDDASFAILVMFSSDRLSFLLDKKERDRYLVT
jgi:hypothetical protein